MNENCETCRFSRRHEDPLDQPIGLFCHKDPPKVTADGFSVWPEVKPNGPEGWCGCWAPKRKIPTAYKRPDDWLGGSHNNPRQSVTDHDYTPGSDTSIIYDHP